MQDYFKLHKSKKTMKPKLTDKSILYAIRQLEKGRDTKTVAEEIMVTQRHVQRLWAEYLKDGTVHVQIPSGRPNKPALSDEEIQMVLDVHKRRPEGVVHTAKRIRQEGHDISRSQVYKIMNQRLGS